MKAAVFDARDKSHDCALQVGSGCMSFFPTMKQLILQLTIKQRVEVSDIGLLNASLYQFIPGQVSTKGFAGQQNNILFLKGLQRRLCCPVR